MLVVLSIRLARALIILIKTVSVVTIEIQQTLVRLRSLFAFREFISSYIRDFSKLANLPYTKGIDNNIMVDTIILYLIYVILINIEYIYIR